MSDLLEQAFERVRALPLADQDDLARVLLRLTGEEQPVYVMTPDEEASFATAREQTARGEFASDERMRAIWAKHGL